MLRLYSILNCIFTFRHMVLKIYKGFIKNQVNTLIQKEAIENDKKTFAKLLCFAHHFSIR